MTSGNRFVHAHIDIIRTTTLREMEVPLALAATPLTNIAEVCGSVLVNNIVGSELMKRHHAERIWLTIRRLVNSVKR